MNFTRVSGLVSNNNDPAKAGRIKCTLPILGGSEVPDWIAPIAVPSLFMIPQVGDEVFLLIPDGLSLVEFPEEMRWIGIGYDAAHAFPSAFTSAYGKQYGIQTPAGHLLLFDDNSKEIHIRHADAKVDIAVFANGKFKVNASSSVVLSTPQTELSELATEPIIKGTTQSQAFTAYTAAISAAAATWTSAGAPTPASNGAFIASLIAATSTLASTIGTWTSTKVKTG